jgi:hypothetical protein
MGKACQEIEAISNRETREDETTNDVDALANDLPSGSDGISAHAVEKAPCDSEDIAEIRAFMAEFDASRDAFSAIYEPWARRQFQHPMPDGYREAMAREEAAQIRLEDGAATWIHALLVALESISPSHAEILSDGQGKAHASASKSSSSKVITGETPEGWQPGGKRG